MKNITISTIVLLLALLPSYSLSQENLLKELDLIFQDREFYMGLKEKRIDSLRNLFSDKMPLSDQFQLNSKIYEEYATYRFDSAMIYVLRKEKLALLMKDEMYVIDTKLDYISLLATTGLIKESMDLLETIDRSKIKEDQLLKYYETFEWAYQRARAFAIDTDFAPIYSEKNMAYMDSVYRLLPVNSPRYNSYKGYILKTNKKWDEAEVALLDAYNNLDVSSRLYAIVSYYLASLYEAKGDKGKQEEFLIKSAISDQVCALKENLSLQTLALYLYQNRPEEIERAYQYIQTSMSDAKFFNNKIRAVQIGYKVPIIISAYKAKSDKENNRLRFLLIAISILMVLMIVAVIHIYRQMKLLNKNRLELLLLNNKLCDLNEKLKEANKIKEEYVGLFIDLSSSYIDQMDNYRKMVARKILANQVDDLLSQTKSSEKMDSMLSEFFQNFDRAFLKLYPTFIEELNDLLEEDKQILLKKGEPLDPELRIYALIRLGITDSSSIASFLRYSPQTVYNKRTKVRNKAKANRDDFESNVMKIGI